MNSIVNFIKSPLGRVVLTVVLYVVVFGILYLFVVSENEWLCGVALMAMVYFGWKALNKITPDIFLIMPIGGWLLYWLIKGILAMFVGLFVAPFQITKVILAKVE